MNRRWAVGSSGIDTLLDSDGELEQVPYSSAFSIENQRSERAILTLVAEELELLVGEGFDLGETLAGSD